MLCHFSNVWVGILFSNVLTMCTFDIRWKHTYVQTWKQSIQAYKNHMFLQTRCTFSVKTALHQDLLFCAILIFIFLLLFYPKMSIVIHFQSVMWTKMFCFNLENWFLISFSISPIHLYGLFWGSLGHHHATVYL